MKKVALYVRTSTDKQEKGLESQVRALENFCNAKEILNYSIYQDSGISGGKNSRPELDRMMNDIRNDQIHVVIVYSFSRFARSTKHLLEALDEFKRLGVSFISLTENIDTNSAIGVALFTIISAISQLEKELISERVKNGVANARAKGKQIGRNKVRNSLLIQELHRKNLSYRKIARLAKCSVATVHRELRSVSQR
ncbi:MAG: recombinase family protein [Bacteriovoracaceae bacterium]|nr:recombinase family protein [Bacteriovoracaceae bacterium]